MSLFRDIERRIDERFRRLFQSEPVPGQTRELVEIQRLIMDRIEERVQMLPRAKRAFPFNEVNITIPVPDAERRTAFEMVFTAEVLGSEIEEFLQRENIEYPGDLKVAVTLVETTELNEPRVTARRIEQPKPEAEAAPAKPELRPIRLTLPDGAKPVLTRQRIHIGRQPEVLDDRRRLVRRNDVVVEGDTVSRAHAHIEFTGSEYRLFDDGSSYGTSAIHEGRLVDVPKAGGRGLRLHSGDDIYLGQVRVFFEIL